MKRTVKTSILIALLFSFCVNADSANKDSLQKVIEQCEVCHGVNSKTSNIAPVLEGMQGWYFKEQVYNFKNSKRGSGSTDQSIITMVDQIKKLDDDQLQFIAKYYSGLKRQFSKDSVSGDSKNGEILYNESCRGCHSSRMGRFFTHSPVITHLEGPYLLAQLKLFVADKRQFSNEDKHKIKMTTIVKQFSDNELADIVAYIKLHYKS